MNEFLNLQNSVHKSRSAYQMLDEADRSGEVSSALLQQVTILLDHCRNSDDASLLGSERALLGACWIRIGDPGKALTYLNHDWSVEDPEAAGLAGTAFMSQGAITSALPALLHAASSETVSGAIRLNLGRALLMSGQTTDALKELTKAREQLGANHALAIITLGEALLSLGRVEEALGMVPEQSNDEQLIIVRVTLLSAASRHEEAATLLQNARKKAPDSIPLLLMGADLFEVMGSSVLAAATLRKALEKDPENIALWARLAQTGSRAIAGPLAREAADKAMALAKDQDAYSRALAFHAHAWVLAAEGKTAEAEAAYADTLVLVPTYVPALSGLGQLLLEKGAVDEAIQNFQKVRAIAPLQGWSQLIHARSEPVDPTVLEAMELAARKPGLEGPVRSSLLFSVAAAWDQKKDYDRAMTVAREANEASKALLSYNPAMHRARVGLEIARFSRSFIESRTGWGNPSRVPIFVLGMPRSGTTLTEQILGSHSQVFGAGELSLVGEQIARLEAWERHVGSQMNYPDCVVDLSQKRSVQLADQWLAQLQAFSPSARHVIDKLPHNFEHIGLIKLFFPNAIIFHCKREPRDIAVSNYLTDYAAKFGGMGFAYDLSWIGEQLVDHDRMMAHWRAVFPGQIFEVVYEELVEDTEHWARRMLGFIGVDWEPSVLEFTDLERSVKTASAWQVRQPVYNTSKARWKRYNDHLAPLEEALSVIPTMTEIGSPPQVPPGQFSAGLEHLKKNRLAEAEECFQQLIAANPKHAAAHHFLGAAQLKQGQAHKAVSAMRNSLQLLSIHATWWENLARAEYAAGNELEAKRAWVRGNQLRKHSQVL